MSSLYVIKTERREKIKKVEKDRRSSKFVFAEVLDEILNHQKWEYENLLVLIDNKEKKKLMVTYVSFVLFTVLTGMLTAIIAMIVKKNGLDEITQSSLYVSLFLIVVGVNLINLSVLKFIAAFKREIVLAYRQLNCTRQSIASIIFSKLEGKIPNADLVHANWELESKNNNDLYWKVYGQHLKYPINNANFRSIYLKTDSKNNEKYDKKALYRSSDLFAICAIFLFTISLTLTPIISFGYIKFSNEGFNGSFIEGIVFGLISLIIVFGFCYSVFRIVRSFFGTAVEHLKLDK